MPFTTPIFLSSTRSRLMRAGVALALGATALLAEAQTPTAAPATAGAPSDARIARLQGALQKRFAAADANHDGRLTRQEAEGHMPWVASHFEAIDTAHTGSVSLQDIEAYAAQQMARRRGGKAAGGMGLAP
ncbi:hypothetical protein [Brachymonas sp.]|uniref:hypothetical protein n=1 Tax=Brachymonas sp. TaxID=1936292 RepID=UPI0035B13A08